MQLKAITIQQPWAWAITTGEKRVENRPRKTSVRGTIAIHAGKSANWLEAGEAFLAQLGWTLPGWYHTGKIVAVAELVDCVPLAAVEGDPFACGPWCYQLANVRLLAEPIRARGQQGWFTVEIPDAAIAAAVPAHIGVQH